MSTNAMSGCIQLMCWVKGDEVDRVFPVQVSSNTTVRELREEIVAKKLSFHEVDLTELNL